MSFMLLRYSMVAFSSSSICVGTKGTRFNPAGHPPLLITIFPVLGSRTCAGGAAEGSAEFSSTSSSSLEKQYLSASLPFYLQCYSFVIIGSTDVEIRFVFARLVSWSEFDNPILSFSAASKNFAYPSVMGSEIISPGKDPLHF